MLKKKIDFNKVKRNFTANKLPLLSNEIITDIIERTQSGKDVNDKKFKPYSENYAKKKGIKKVNLTQTGKMLNNINWKKIKGGIRLYFPSANERAKAHGNQFKNDRVFFGLSKKQIKELKPRLQELYKLK